MELRKKVRITSLLPLVARQQRGYESQQWLFVLGLFLDKQPLDVWKGVWAMQK